MIRNKRFILDVVLFVFIVTLFKRHAISADYHVWGGLVFCGLICLHIWLNRKWLQKLFCKQKKLLDWVSILLLFNWLALLVTGILAAKQFGIELHVLKPYHKFLGALALLLAAAHIGLHWQYLKNNILQSCGFLRYVPRQVAIAAMAAMLCLGGYGFVDSGFTKWISAPFTVVGRPANPGGRGKRQPQPFNWERLGKALAELSGMLYLGAYVVQKTTKKS